MGFVGVYLSHEFSVPSGKLIIQDCVIHICHKNELSFLVCGEESETKWTTKKEIYSFEEDADDKDHHSIFYVMFCDASKIKGEEEKDGIMVKSPSALIISIFFSFHN